MIFGVKQTRARTASTFCRCSALVVGLVFGIVFVRRATHGWSDPLIDLELFRVASFNASLAINVLSASSSMFGYFLFVAQYLQLVLDLSPLEAGLWSLPSGGRRSSWARLAPSCLLRRFRPGAGGGACRSRVAAVGLRVFAQVDAVDGLTRLVIASLIDRASDSHRCWP